MQSAVRKQFNDNFSEEKYLDYINKVEGLDPGSLDVRNAETPIFIPTDFKNKMLSSCEDIIDFIIAPEFKALTQRSIPAVLCVPGDEGRSQFIVFVFGICENE